MMPPRTGRDRRMGRGHRSAGLSLTELIVVMGIVAMSAAVAAPNLH